MKVAQDSEPTSVPDVIRIEIGSQFVSFQLGPVGAAARGRRYPTPVDLGALYEGITEIFEMVGILTTSDEARHRYQERAREERENHDGIAEVKDLALKLHTRINHPSIRKLLTDRVQELARKHRTFDECWDSPEIFEEINAQLLLVAAAAARSLDYEVDHTGSGRPVNDDIDEFLWRLAELFGRERWASCHSCHDPIYDYYGHMQDVMRKIQLKDAKANLSAVVDQATRGKPSVITRHGKPEAVVVGFADWERLSHVPSFGRLLMSAPLEPRDLPERNRAPMRDAGL